MKDHEIQSYQSLIDFSKTIIAINSSVLTAVIGYVLLREVELEIKGYFMLFGFVVSIFISLFGFGYATAALRDGTHSNKATLFSNIAGYIMILSISSLYWIDSPSKTSVDVVLKNIESSTNDVGMNLKPEKLISLTYDNNEYVLIYKIDSVMKNVIYSTKKKQIVSIKDL